MLAQDQTREFHPVLISRRGELIAWGSTLLVGFGWVVLAETGSRVPGSVKFLGILLLLAAFSISLGNWMDRQTRLVLASEGISFQNGLRNVHMQWEDIRQVQVYPGKWGQRVSVIGPQAHFEFRTLGEIAVQGEVKGRMGFVEGDRILHEILENAGLVPKPDSPSTNPYYYVRK